MVSKRSYAAPAGRDLEIAPTLDAGISIALAIHSFDGRDLEIAGISIALVIHSFDPTVYKLLEIRELRDSSLGFADGSIAHLHLSPDRCHLTSGIDTARRSKGWRID